MGSPQGSCCESSESHLVSARHLIPRDLPRTTVQRENAFPFLLTLPSSQLPFPGLDVSRGGLPQSSLNHFQVEDPKG